MTMQKSLSIKHIFAAVSLSASLGACTTLSVNSPVPSNQRSVQVDSGTCMVLNSVTDKGGFLHAERQAYDNTEFDRNCWAVKLATTLVDSEIPEMRARALAAREKFAPPEAKAFDDYLTTRGYNMEDLLKNWPKNWPHVVANTVENGCQKISYRMPDQAEQSAPVVFINCDDPKTFKTATPLTTLSPAQP